MNISIGSKISKLRKQNNLTQEQLAELLNISNAAVSKWESGITYPDIETLPLIAKIFKISIDSLFEFDINNESLDEFYKQAEVLRLNGNKNDLISLLDDALKVYPNDFNLNLMMAKALLDKSLNINPVDKNLAKKSIKYYDKALILDKDGKNSASIIQNKSFVLGSIGQYEEANKLLSSLKQESHTVQIANNLIKMGKYEEGNHVSPEARFLASSTSDDINDRLTRIRFTLNNIIFDRNNRYFLEIRDANSNDLIDKQQFIIDITNYKAII